MGAAARQLARDTVAPPRPRLRVVQSTGRAARARSLATSRVVAVCLLAFACAGALRVVFAVEAAEAAIDAAELRVELKNEQQTGRVLEADRSALAAPSRIEALACQTLSMDRPSDVRYIHLACGQSDQAASGEGAQTLGARAADIGGKLAATVLDLAAGEAQVLLVGDVGLGSLR